MNMSNQAMDFFKQLETEVLENRDGLEPDAYYYLEQYYQGLKDKAQLRPFFGYNWTRRVAPMQKVIMSLPKRQTPWRILDAGCGTGTTSLFWSTLRDDVAVTGVDFHAGRLNTAKARHQAYEKRLGKRLSLRFVEQDIFKILISENFDLVWVMEAISHIDPAEEFLASVANNVGAAGYLVISDSHLLNPAMAWYVYKLRRRGVTERTSKLTSTGETISYAQERLFTVGQLTRQLKLAGFQSVQTQLSVFFPPSVAYKASLLKICMKLDLILNQVPLLRNVGGIYTVVAGH